MRPTFAIPNVGTLREITIWKAILLPLVTFSIYIWVLIYQHSKDLQATAAQQSSLWKWMFWLALPTFGITMIVLYVLNGMTLKDLRARLGMKDDPMWIIALVLALVLSPVGQILWAVHFNDTMRAASGAASAAPGAAPPPAQVA